MSGTSRVDAADAQGVRFSALLGRARQIARDLLAPRANAADRADGPPMENLRALAAAGLLGLTTPERYGGQGAPEAVAREYQEILAAACGLTTFVQAQHQTGCSLIAGGENEALKEALLPRLARGAQRCGVGFSHLRRPGPPLLRAERAGSGFLLNGTAPWVTGWGLLDEVVLGATLPDDRLLYVLTPLVESGTLRPSAPMQLCAMNASATVALTCENLPVGPERYVKTITRADMAAADRATVLKPTALPFGVATACIALLEGQGQAEVAAALATELTAARRAVAAWIDRPTAESYWPRAARIRAWAIELGVRAAHAAVAAGGGGANDRQHTAQRLYREAMFYTVLTQTRDVQAATLALLGERARRAAAESGPLAQPAPQRYSGMNRAGS